jgi:hypothetical protein
MDYQTALNHILNVDDLILPTLGVISKFKVTTADDLICITNSSGRIYKVKIDVWDAVVGRVNELNPNERSITGNYSLPNWDNCPNMILCPYVAKLYLYLREQFH